MNDIEYYRQIRELIRHSEDSSLVSHRLTHETSKRLAKAKLKKRAEA